MSDNMTEEEKASSFKTTIHQHVFGGFISLGLSLGAQLGVFDAMIDIGEPASAKTIARKCNCKERYVEELLRMLVTGDIIDYTDQDGEVLYNIAAYKRSALTGSISGSFYIPLLAAPYSKLIECFQENGPLGLDEQDVLPAYNMWEHSRESFFHSLLNSIPACYPKSVKSIESDCYCLDIGCGNGHFFIQLAERYPNSAFLGIDISEASIQQANENSKHLSNIHFQIQDSRHFPDDWLCKFDYIFMAETLHDLSFARKTLKLSYDALIPGGILSVIDINLHSSLDKQKQDPFGSVVSYDFSLFHCLPRALSTEKAEGLGPCYGYDKLEALIKEARFKEVIVKDIPDMTSCLHLIAQK